MDGLKLTCFDVVGWFLLLVGSDTTVLVIVSCLRVSWVLCFGCVDVICFYFVSLRGGCLMVVYC